MAPQHDHREKIQKAGSAECSRLCRKPDAQLKFIIDRERLTLAQIWDVPDHIKSVERLRREEEALQRERQYEWRKFKVHASFSALNSKAKHRASSSGRAIRVASSPSRLPSYSVALRDENGRLFPFMRTSYSNAGTTKAGRGRRLVVYQTDGAHVLDDGSLAVSSNVGDTPEEMAEAFDQIEKVNRSAAKNAKVVHHMIIQSLYELSPGDQFAMAKRYCEQAFARQGLPYVLAMHAPDAEGDQRNWHFHVAFSYRPVERTGEGEWSIDRFLRTDLDTPKGWKELRYLLAEQLNHTCEMHGLAKRYTHLSYAASGLDYVPQQHLGAGLTAKVRRGETVAANANNHRSVALNEVRHALRQLKAELLARTVTYRKIAADQLSAVKLAAAVAASRPVARMASMMRGVTVPAALQPSTGRTAGSQNDNARPGARIGRAVLLQTLRPPPLPLKSRPAPSAPSMTFRASVAPRALERRTSKRAIDQTGFVMPALPSRLVERLVYTSIFRASVLRSHLPTPLEPMALPEHPARNVPGSLRRPPAPLGVGNEPQRRSVGWSFAMSMAMPIPLAQPVMAQGSGRVEGLATLGIAARVPRPLAVIERDAASISLSFRMTIKLPSFLVPDVATAAAKLRSTAALQAVANAVPDTITPPAGALPKAPSLAQIDGLSAPSARDEAGLAERNFETPSRAPYSDDSDDRVAFFPRRRLHKQTEGGEEDRRAEVIKPKADTMDEPSLLNLAAIYRRLAHAKAQLSKIPRDGLPARNGAWPAPLADDSAVSEAETAKPLEDAGPKDHPPPVTPTDRAANVSLAGSSFRRNERGKLVIRPLTERPGDTATHAPLEHGKPTSNVAPAIETVPGRDQDNSRGFRASDKITRAVKSLESAISGSSPVRGLHPKIDLWMDADARNDRDDRLWHAACVAADPVARAKVLQADKPTQMRFARDWEANKSARGLNAGGRDGREITGE
jgi:hypothetical protein